MKRTISFIASMFMSISALTAPLFNIGAIAYDYTATIDICRGDPNAPENSKYLLDLGDMFFQEKPLPNTQTNSFLPDNFMFSHVRYDPETSRVCTKNGTIIYTRYCELSFNISGEDVDAFVEYIKKDEILSKDYIYILVESLLYYNNGKERTIRIPLFDGHGLETARKIKQDVEKIADIKDVAFTPVKERYCRIDPFYLTYVPLTSDCHNSYGILDVELDEIKETLEAYVAENNLDFTVESFSKNRYSIETMGSGDFYGYQLVPKNEIAESEKIKLSKQIYDDLGYHSWYARDGRESSSDAEGTYSSESIDMSNNVDGDANCDGEYTIADATAILQSLGNPDKYGLSLQGAFNADIYNVGDGVTPADALEVQKAMAKKG